MLKPRYFISLIILILALAGAGVLILNHTKPTTSAPVATQKKGETMKQPKTLIVYYSRTGNTKVVADMIQQQVGGDLAQIETKADRPTNYRAEVEQNAREQEQDTLPELKATVPNLKSYARIFIGSPTWNMALPQAVVAFMQANDFAGKTVIPFNTNGGYGIGSVFTQIKQGARGANVLKGFSIKGGEEINGVRLAIQGNRQVTVDKAVIKWLKDINQLQ